MPNRHEKALRVPELPDFATGMKTVAGLTGEPFVEGAPATRPVVAKVINQNAGESNAPSATISFCQMNLFGAFPAFRMIHAAQSPLPSMDGLDH